MGNGSKWLFFGVLFGLSLIVASGEVMAVKSARDANDGIVIFPDPGLERAVRNKLGIGNDEDLTRELLVKLQELTADKQGIENLEGLQYCINVKKLSLRNNSIGCIDQLAALSQLEKLQLDYNNIKCLLPLQGLKSLKYLSLEANMVSDLDPLRSLASLEELLLGSNNVSDILPLSGLEKLKDLRLQRNMVAVIPSEFFQNKARLETLYLNHNPINDLSPLQSLTNAGLKNLYLGWNLFEDFKVIGKFNGLTRLSLFSMQPAIDNLDFLFVMGQDGQLHPVFPSLKYLDLQDNNLQDINKLQKYISLDTLFLSANGLTDVSALAELPKLKKLVIQGNFIRDITPLCKRGSPIVELYLDNNPIDPTSLASLSLMSNLKTISLSQMRPKLRDLSVFQKLNKPTYFDLRNNAISDLGPLVPIIKRGDRLDVRSNWLDAQDCDQLRMLQNNGATVYSEIVCSTPPEMESDNYRENSDEHCADVPMRCP